MRWLSLHASVDGVHDEYVGLLETLNLLEEGGSGGSMEKGFVKKNEKCKVYRNALHIESNASLTNRIEQNFSNWSDKCFEDHS